MSDAPTLAVGGLADLFAQCERRYEYVELPRINLRYRIQSLTERERSDYEAGMTDRKTGMIRNLASQRRILCAKVLVDEAGKRLLADSDADRLGEIDAEIVGAIYDAACRLVGLVKTDEAKEKN